MGSRDPGREQNGQAIPRMAEPLFGTVPDSFPLARVGDRRGDPPAPPGR